MSKQRRDGPDFGPWGASAVVQYTTIVVSELAALENECRCPILRGFDRIPLERTQNLKDSLKQIEDSLEKLSYDGGNDLEARQNRPPHTRHIPRHYTLPEGGIKAAFRRLDLALQRLRDLDIYLLKTKTVGRGDHDFVNKSSLSQKMGECVSCNACRPASEGLTRLYLENDP
jgi:hypothetical protein